ncbi:MAG: TIGR03618 family F420-dependent PPOX class oxidoreductase [Chloroflexi bacterium]|nr:TIGR03618 family F420-dependent PPOX class oxidoreductase [Chloroflexota bacterium]
MPKPSPERQAQFLRTMPNAVLATNSRRGGPQMTPNWYLWTGDAFHISTANWTAKVRNIRSDPNVSLCIDDPVSGDYVAVYGQAVVIEGPAARAPTLELIRKYRAEPDVLPHWERINARNDRVIISVTPQRVLWRDH